MRFGRAAIASTIVLLVPCWPALVNGQPFFTLDTIAYLRAAAHGIHEVVGIESIWYAPAVAPAGEIGPAAPGGAHPTEPGASGSAVLMARSIYYGLFLLAAHPLAKLWAAVIAQSAVTAAAVFLTLRSFLTRPIGHTVASVLVLAAVTPVAFIVSLLMPDILAPIAILACAHIAVRFDRLARWELLFWFCALCYATLAHFSHLLTVAGLAVLVAALGSFLSVNRPRWLACGVIAAALAVAFLGERSFSLAVEKMTGAPPVRPPFLMARMIGDGPGYRYLRATCPGNGMAVCAYLDRLPTRADNFLWATDSKTGVFSATDTSTRRALSAEQLRFAWNVLLFDPVGQASASLANWIGQLMTFARLTDFSYGHTMRQAFASSLPEPYLTRLRATAAARQALPLQAASYVFLVSAVASSLVLVVAFLAYRGTPAMVASKFWEFAGLVVAGVVLNAAVCGALSATVDRYQARVVWLVTLLALVCCLQLGASQRRLTAAER